MNIPINTINSILPWVFTRQRFFKTLLITWFVGGYISTAFAGHPGENPSEGMSHPSEPLPEDAAVPYLSAKLTPDMMDGFNLAIELHQFVPKIPYKGTDDFIMQGKKKIMQGHMHLYLNGQKIMRLYDVATHLPRSILKEGINSLTVSVNNHMHGTFTYDGQEIQTTILFDASTDSPQFIKSQFSWPKTKL